jgi:histidinol-phosphate aminotransferase
MAALETAFSIARPVAGPRPKRAVEAIRAYDPGVEETDGLIKLCANENPLGCSPAAREAFARAGADLNIYPDSRGSRLRAALVERYGIEPERIILGCGTDEIFALLNQTFLEPGDNIVQGQFGFSSYGIGARACLGEVRRAPEPSRRIDVDQILAQVNERTRLVFVANPANPTGTYIVETEIRRLQASLPANVLLVLDGAYAEFCTDGAYSDGLELARSAPNLVVTHTFSKIHGLAALRIGWAYAPAAVADAVNRIRLPFNTSVPAQLAAVAGLGDVEHQRKSLAHVKRWRPRLAGRLEAMGLEVTPSGANFFLVDFPDTPGRTAPEAEAFLASRRVIVRGVAPYGLSNSLRITIGLDAENEALLAALESFLGAGEGIPA